MTVDNIGPSRRRPVGRRLLSALAMWFAGATVWPAPVAAQTPIDLERPPIGYAKATAQDAVARLQRRIDAGEVALTFDPRFGYLKSVLRELQVSDTSQMLVFAKTSLQVKHISPRSPRAVYFSDDVYVGWVRGGNIEISAVDPMVGANFYLVRPQERERPRFERQTYDCLQCHASGSTRDVPGHLVRSVYPGPDGHPLPKSDSFLSDHSSPLAERWGGWYVTGEHGAQRHLGNLVVRQADDLRQLDLESGANASDLTRWFDTSPYLTPHSDIVALMVLEHQANLHNRITRANFLARMAQHEATTSSSRSERSAGDRAEATARMLDEAAEPVVEHLLFADEIKLTDPIVGSSSFARQFAARGPRDRQGRSLRDFDLQTRLLRYPCSYLIYSEAFDQLPPLVRDDVYQRLWKIVAGHDARPKYQHLSAADRRAVLEILRDTKRDLPEYWRP